jgi:membrane protease subunit HflK
MLTEDESIVDVRLAVQYQVKDAKDFLFNVLEPTATLKQVTESAERGVVGQSKINFVLTEGRTQIVGEIQTQIQKLMDNYGAGVQVTSVNLQDAQPPEEVQAAFEDAIKAREDKQRYIREAQAYTNDIIPKARGAAARRIQDAEGYMVKVVSEAEGESARFDALLVEYKRAPEVTRKRLYLSAMEEVLRGTETVIVDVKGGNNLLYLPLDKLGSRGESASNTTVKPKVRSNEDDFDPTRSQSTSNRGSSRGRDGRGRK